MLKGIDFELKNLIKNKESEGIGHLLRSIFSKIIKDMTLKDDKHFFDYVYTLNYFVKELETDNSFQEFIIQIKEYLFIIDVYLRENISTSLLEQLEDYQFSMLVIERLRYRNFDYETLKNYVLGSEPSEEDVLFFDATLGYLICVGLINNDNGIYSITNKCENLFELYSSNKKLTNKYERIKRQQINSKNQKVDVEFLDKIEKIKNGFSVLEIFYVFAQADITSDFLLEETNLSNEELDLVLYKLEKLNLITKNENIEDDCTYNVTTTGKNVFKIYKKSKQYTNKYEKIKRNEYK